GAGSPVDRALELRLAHLRPTLDVLVPRLFVELVTGPSARAAVRAQPAAPARRHVVRRRLRGGRGLTGARPLLVDRASGDLLGEMLRPAVLLEPFLDVLVLTLALVAP